MGELRWERVPYTGGIANYFCDVCRCCADPGCDCRPWKAKAFYELQGLTVAEETLIKFSDLDLYAAPSICDRCFETHAEDVLDSVRGVTRVVRGE